MTKICHLGDTLYQIFLNSADEEKTFGSSAFLGKPVNMVVSARYLNVWQNMIAASHYAKTLKIYCGSTRVLRTGESSVHRQAPGLMPPQLVASTLDVHSDVLAMRQPDSDVVYVYGGLCDYRQRMPTLYSINQIKHFLSALLSLDGRLMLPVTAQMVERLGVECDVGDPLAEIYKKQVTDKLKNISDSSKERWLAFLVSRCEKSIAAWVLADMALNEDVDVYLVPSLCYFMACLTGDTARSRPKRYAEIKFKQYVGSCIAKRCTVRVGSKNTVHISFTDSCSVLVSALGSVESVCVDGHDLPVEIKSKKLDPSGIKPIIMALARSEDIVDAVKAAPLMKIFVQGMISRPHPMKSRLLAELKKNLDTVFTVSSFPRINRMRSLTTANSFGAGVRSSSSPGV